MLKKENGENTSESPMHALCMALAGTLGVGNISGIALAIAFGTAHGIYKSKPILNMDIISQVRELTGLPLVMHGGSGISHDEYREVIRRGIGKINYYSYMSYAGYAEAKATVEEREADFFHNLAFRVQNAMKENALATLRVFSGKE